MIRKIKLCENLLIEADEIVAHDDERLSELLKSMKESTVEYLKFMVSEYLRKGIYEHITTEFKMKIGRTPTIIEIDNFIKEIADKIIVSVK